MEYTCELAGVNKYLYARGGMRLSLCNSCKTRDCTNPIEFIKYSFPFMEMGYITPLTKKKNKNK